VRRILVIEDNAAVREEIADILMLEGFDVTGAEDGQAGLERAQATQPDLIICDVMMPRLDGYGTLQALRRDAATHSIPFVFLTAKALEDDIQKGLELGANGYLAKPFRIDDLLRVVTTSLGELAAS
jgi:CheY-like chemotaxis protein